MRKLVVHYIVKKLPVLFGNYWRFVTVFAKASHLPLSWVRWIQFMHSHLISLRSILKLSSIYPRAACLPLSKPNICKILYIFIYFQWIINVFPKEYFSWWNIFGNSKNTLKSHTYTLCRKLLLYSITLLGSFDFILWWKWHVLKDLTLCVPCIISNYGNKTNKMHYFYIYLFYNLYIHSTCFEQSYHSSSGVFVVVWLILMSFDHIF